MEIQFRKNGEPAINKLRCREREQYPQRRRAEAMEEKITDFRGTICYIDGPEETRRAYCELYKGPKTGL